MTTQTKSVLTLLGTLLIGLVLGAVLNARFAENRIEQLYRVRSEEGLIMFIEDNIQFRDARQKQAVHEILKETAPNIIAIFESSRSRTTSQVIDTMRASLAPYLDENQLDQIEEVWKTRQKGRGERGLRNRRRIP